MGSYVSILFQKPAPRPGRVILEERKEEMNLLIKGMRSGKPTKVDFVTTAKSKKRDELLATRDGSPVKVRTLLIDDETVVKTAGKLQKVQDTLTGRTFILEMLPDGRILALTGEGAPALLSDENIIRQRYDGQFGQPDPFVQAIPDHELAIGDRVPKLAELIKGRLCKYNKYLVVSGEELWLKEIVDAPDQPKIGVFQFKMRMEQSGSPLAYAMDLDGLVRMRSSDSALLSMTIEAPVTITDGKQPNPWNLTKIHGNGRMTSKALFTHSQAPPPPPAS